MNILFYGINYSPELTGIGKYSGEMASWFFDNNHSIQVITAPPYYPEWKVKEGYKQFVYSSKSQNGIDVLRCPLFVPSNPTTITRLVHLLSFSASSFFALFSRFFKKPDMVVVVQPTLFCAPAAIVFSRLVGSKCVMHIQDYEVDAMFGLGMINKNKLAGFSEKIESFILRRFDAVSTISYSMMDRAVNKGVDKNKLIFFPNWSDTDFVHPGISGDALRQEWGLSESDKVVLYAGNIGRKQGLELLIQAAEEFSNNPNTKFIIVGAGAYVKELQKLASSKKINNLFFKPLLPWERVPEMLAMADIHLVMQKKGVADAVLPSKLTNILSAGGHALVTAEAKTELGTLADKFPGIYTRIEPESLLVLVSALQELLSKDTRQTNAVAREYAEKYLNKNKVLEQFEQSLLKCCGNPC